MIQATALQKSFDQKTTLSGVDFTIETGDRFYIAGRSGAGKSVTLKLLTGLLKPDGGQITIDGQRADVFDEKQWLRLREKFGVVFQGGALFDSLNVLENVGARLYESKTDTPRNIEARAATALKQVGLSPDLLKKFPAELSGGMRKRVAIARAIVHEPLYLFYDEPTSGLDPLTSDLIDELILQLAQKQGVTTVVITHDMVSVQRNAARVLMLENAQAIFCGPADEFAASPHPVIRGFLARK